MQSEGTPAANSKLNSYFTFLNMINLMIHKVL